MYSSSPHSCLSLTHLETIIQIKTLLYLLNYSIHPCLKISNLREKKKFLLWFMCSLWISVQLSTEYFVHYSLDENQVTKPVYRFFSTLTLSIPSTTNAVFFFPFALFFKQQFVTHIHICLIKKCLEMYVI